MNNLLKTTLIGLFFGTFGTTIGGIIGVTFKNTSKKFLSFVLAFASGLMISIVCFDLIPEAFNLTGIVNIFIGIMFGIVTMIVCDILVDRKFNNKIKFKDNKNTLLKTGIIVSIGLALHNFPEGLAIGSGFEASIKLGISLAIAICLHDIPEGISKVDSGGNMRDKTIGIRKLKNTFEKILKDIRILDYYKEEEKLEKDNNWWVHHNIEYTVEI